MVGRRCLFDLGLSLMSERVGTIGYGGRVKSSALREYRQEGGSPGEDVEVPSETAQAPPIVLAALPAASDSVSDEYVLP